MADSMIKPSGLAGTLLAAGASCVVAPLWPVHLDIAEQVGLAVLRGLANGEEPWVVLAKLNAHSGAQSSTQSPSLGPPPSLSERQAEHNHEKRSFIAWIA